MSIAPSAEVHVLVRERTFTISRGLTVHALNEIIDILHLDRSTGKLTINLSQGAVQSVQFEERARLASY